MENLLRKLTINKKKNKKQEEKPRKIEDEIGQVPDINFRPTMTEMMSPDKILMHQVNFN
jgi:hypothetical protein